MKILKLFLLLTLLSATTCDHEEDYNAEPTKSIWISDALFSLSQNEYPNIKAIAWWHEDFDNSQLRIDSSSESLLTYQNKIANPMFVTTPVFANNKLQAPNQGIYHSAYPDFGGTEDVVSTTAITDFESLAGKPIVWAYFSNNWYNNIQFPSIAVNTISSAGKVPFIRIMPRTNFDEGAIDPNYSLANIINGNFDAELNAWAAAAASTNIPLLAEFGTEINGDWFPWSGLYNGADNTAYGDPNLADGPERFRDAYRHVIDICNANGATNITWFFHVNASSEPVNNWNTIANYYPGDNYIDWLGVSVYGPQEANEYYDSFRDILTPAYQELTSLSNKPIAVLEFAITEL